MFEVWDDSSGCFIIDMLELLVFVLLLVEFEQVDLG